MLCLLLPLALASLACITLTRIAEPHLSGMWKGMYEDKLLVFDFDTSGDVRLYIDDEVTRPR